MSGKKSASGSETLSVLYDGWTLSHASGSSAAVHLLAVLSALPPDVHPLVALPGPTPHVLPAGADQLRRPAADTPFGRLNWEQRVLPVLAAQNAVGMLHLFGAAAPLAGPLPVAISPAETAPAARPRGVAERLRKALVYGAASSPQTLLWPADLPPPAGAPPVHLLPPLVHPAFWGPSAWDSRLPDAYILAAGNLHPPALELLAEGWKWAGPAIGENFPLVLAGLTGEQQNQLAGFLRGRELEETVRFLPTGSLPDRAALLGQATAVICLDDPTPWGDPLLEALAAGKPIAAPETEAIAARVGPAAYLFPPRDARALGAALTTLVVQEDVAENLSRGARARAMAWGSEQYGRQLAEVYRRIART